MIETFSNANAHMVRMVHTMVGVNTPLACMFIELFWVYESLRSAFSPETRIDSVIPI